MSRKFKLPQNSISFGEITPDGRAREDIVAYSHGVKELLNWNLLAEGGVERRWGLDWISALTAESVALPFEFSEDQQYVFVFAATSLKVWEIDDEDADLLPILTYVGEFTSNADWTNGMLDTLRWAARGDTMFLCDGTGVMPMKEIVRTNSTTFTISDFAFEEHSDGQPMYQPYFRFADPAITITPSATTGSITLTASDDVFDDPLHVGVIFRLTDVPATDDPKEVIITAVASATSATATVRETLDGILATTVWDEAVFSPVRGYQRSVMMAEQRLMIGGSRDYKFGNWLSNTTAFHKFSVGAGDASDMIDRPIDSGKVEEVRGLVHGDNIEIFTDGGQHYIPLSESSTLTPDATPVRNQTEFGTHKKVPPKVYDGSSIFMQQTGNVVREYIYDDTAGKYNSPPVSLLASHLFKNPAPVTGKLRASDMAGAAVIDGSVHRPESYWYTINRGNGEIVYLHSMRADKITGWGHWNTEGLFHSVVAVGKNLFAITKRYGAVNAFAEAFADDFGNGEYTYHLERFEPSFGLDFAKKVTVASPRTKFSGLAHLANRTVDVVSRGTIHHGKFAVDANGVIEIDEEETEIVAGLDYTMRMKNLRPRFNAQGYTISGSQMRLVAIHVDMETTYTLEPNGFEMIIRQVDDDFSVDPDPVSGLREFALNGWSKDAEVTIVGGAPLPVKILGFMLEVIA